MTEFILVQKENNRATVTLNREELHNAFNDQMIDELNMAFTELGQDESVRVIVLAANGKSFCAGADLNWMKSMLNYSFDENKADAHRLATMLKTIAQCPKPVIGKIHGAVFGGGVGLVSVCDMAVALNSVKFCLSEVKLGLLPAVISPFVLRKMPQSFAHRYFLTAERFPAEEALRMGLISAVVSDESALDQTIDQWCEALFQNGPQAVSLCKHLISDIVGTPLLEAIDIAVERIAERRISTEGQEGMKAFLEKRPPNWIQKDPQHVS